MSKDFKLFSFVLILVFIPFCGSAQNKLKKFKSFGKNPGNLIMLAHIPIVSKKKTKPMVVVLHGCTQSASNVAELTGWNKIADTNDFIVLYPQQKVANNPQLCFNWFRREDQRTGSGEGQSIHEMIQFAIDSLHVNQDSIFVTGLSAGAGMTMIMLSTHPETFQAGASFAGPPYQIARGSAEMTNLVKSVKSINTDTLTFRVLDQNPEYKGNYPSLFVFQGTSDPIVKPGYGMLIVKQWIGVHNAEKVVPDSSVVLNSEAKLTLTNFRNKKNEIIVSYIEAKDLGHALLIDPGKDKYHGGKAGLFGKDRNWHSTLYVAKEFGLVK